jgi:hypothetical protein
MESMGMNRRRTFIIAPRRTGMLRAVCIGLLLCLSATAYAQTEEELVTQRMYIVAYRGDGGSSGEIPTQFLRADEGKLAILIGTAKAYDIRVAGTRLTFKFESDKGGRKRVIDTILDRRPDGSWVGAMTGPRSGNPSLMFQDRVEMRPEK